MSFNKNGPLALLDGIIFLSIIVFVFIFIREGLFILKSERTIGKVISTKYESYRTGGGGRSGAQPGHGSKVAYNRYLEVEFQDSKGMLHKSLLQDSFTTSGVINVRYDGSKRAKEDSFINIWESTMKSGLSILVFLLIKKAFRNSSVQNKSGAGSEGDTH